MMQKKRYNPWTDLYDAMGDWVPKNDAERIAARKIEDGADFNECMECAELTWEEFHDLLRRLGEWENENCDKPENWYRNPEIQAKELKRWLMGMSDRDIQRVLKDIPKDVMVTAMNSWDRELMDLIVRNLPRIVKEEIAGDMEDKNRDYSVKQMAEANRRFERTIQMLEDTGEIHIYPVDDSKGRCTK